jgi:alkanesulfonate monooxygenase SsuD/methylene tetrahydromethanopterin reductase-like flavin-dependent oxidoreductase (luciferase family)
VSTGEGVARLDEACTILTRMWTGDAFDFDGRYYRLRNARCVPTPVQERLPLLVSR